MTVPKNSAHRQPFAPEGRQSSALRSAFRRPVSGQPATIGAITVLIVLVLGGCAAGGYYWQAAQGQVDLMARREPIAQLLAHSDLSGELRQRLATIRDIRNFAVSSLALPDNGSYRNYVQLDRPYALWNVFGAPELELTPHEWCYPMVGCLAYRGYFSESEAVAEAAALREQGLDSWVAGVPAYSTLGWFDDPVLSTFAHWPVGRVAELLFHELAHQQLFVAGDTTFNESYATTVGRAGAELWLRAHATPEEQQIYLRQREARDRFLNLVMSARAQLEVLYYSDLDDAQKRVGKASTLADFRSGFQQWRELWGGPLLPPDVSRGGNAWFAAIGAYEQWVPAFKVLLEEAGGDFAAFHQVVATIAGESESSRLAEIEALSQRAAELADGSEHLPAEPTDRLADANSSPSYR